MGDPVPHDAPPARIPPQVPGGPPGHVAHQFLNTGLAVHASAIRNFLGAEGVDYERES